MEKIYKLHIFTLTFIAAMSFCGVLGLVLTDRPIPMIFLWAGIAVCVFAPFLAFNFQVFVDSEKIEGFYQIGKKRRLVYSCRFEEITEIDYTRFAFTIVRRSGKPILFWIQTGLKDYKEIMRLILENAKNIKVITPAARKKLFKDKLIASPKV